MRIALLTDRYPTLSETFVTNEVEALRRLGHEVVVVAGQRGDVGAAVPVTVATEAGTGRQLVALAQLAARHPLGAMHDLHRRRRWRHDEEPRPLRELAIAAACIRDASSEHLHVHFAAGAALDGMRLAALTGLPWSLTVHAYDLYAIPRNLPEKVRSAAFTTSGCDYTVRDLRAIEPAAAARIHKIVMGVDGEVFRRESAYPGGRHVLAVGRLVEKKGFGDLIAAASLMRDRGFALERLTIVGAGPLHATLSAQVTDLGLGDVVELAGPRSPDEIRALLETTDLLAMPCVVAADGDRDSMPVVVKEALAMEVPVVASDEVGLPEVVRPGWGLLHPPGDPGALAQTLEDLLARSPAERHAMGVRGRAWVLENADVATETARLAGLIESAKQPG